MNPAGENFRDGFTAGRLAGLAILLLCLWPLPPAQALQIALGSGTNSPGATVTIPITVSGTPANLSAFCLFVTNTSSFGPPSITAGTEQTNLTLLVDDFSNGIYRVTGFVLSGPPIGNGVVARLHYLIPAGSHAGTYPLAVNAVPPANAPGSLNPEARALVTSDAIASTGGDGLVLVSANGSPPRLVSLTATGHGTFQLAITNSADTTFTVLTATNVTVPLANWTVVAAAVQISPGLFQFTDPQATNDFRRFYQLRSP